MKIVVREALQRHELLKRKQLLAPHLIGLSPEIANDIRVHRPISGVRLGRETKAYDDCEETNTSYDQWLPPGPTHSPPLMQEL